MGKPLLPLIRSSTPAYNTLYDEYRFYRNHQIYIYCMYGVTFVEEQCWQHVIKVNKEKNILVPKWCQEIMQIKTRHTKTTILRSFPQGGRTVGSDRMAAIIE